MQKTVFRCLVLSVIAGLVSAKPADSDCVVADFRTLALTVHNPTERLAAAAQWLQSHGDACSLKDIAVIKSSSPSWLGSADSPSIQQTLDHYYNVKAKGAKEELPAAAQVNPPAAPSVAAVPPKPKVLEAPVAKPNAASKTPAASAAATTPADAINTGIAAAVAAAAASKAAGSIAKTTTNK